MKKYYSIVVLIFVVFFSSCRGDQEEKLVGNWEQIPFTDTALTLTKTYWQFYSGKKVTIFQVSEERIDSVSFTWSLSGSVFDVVSGDDDPGYAPAARDPRGQYWVDHFSKDQFKATKRKHPDGSTDAVYMRLEMVKR